MTVLLLLDESPMHPYGVRQRIREWGKDLVINVTQRNAIYQIIERLERAGLIAVKETSRNENRPERTVYETTRAGADTARAWMLDMLAAPADEYPEFPAALALLNSISPEETRAALEKRIKTLEGKLAHLDNETQAAVADRVERIHLIETEYLRTVLRAELTWVRAFVDDLRTGDITWRAPDR
ncbi:PadR family transcriptional regulator [Nonomuraea sp. NPDC050394]|uniref:PadR family transcriptional regulator n=1 Tax=Nonomuraea sp. NPDC050394 TaxID=3364363 RepID=UPI0037B97CC8